MRRLVPVLLLLTACDAAAVQDAGLVDARVEDAPYADAGVCDDDGDPCTREVLEADGCAHVAWDTDDDGYAPTLGSCGPASGLEAGDCVDSDATIRPGADEACNGRDDDCDLAIDEGYEGVVCAADADGDGAPTSDEKLVFADACLDACPVGFADVERAPDCDDRDPAVRPGVGDCPE